MLMYGNILAAAAIFAAVGVDGKRSPNLITAFITVPSKSNQIRSHLILANQRDKNDSPPAVLTTAATSIALVLCSFPSACSAATIGAYQTSDVVVFATLFGALLTIKIQGDVDINPVSSMYIKKSDQEALPASTDEDESDQEALPASNDEDDAPVSENLEEAAVSNDDEGKEAVMESDGATTSEESEEKVAE
eukprot:CAMPEP_0194322784 /NCGR_PEP_ID=MMETSP0171-20130528/22277_1 /TAXON_ID=218684 /ORGANISM="Corethron pennatum, Strain L29A3" /LENGTH=191 /DNA_ID=CAMNT_0039081159 /DNA_START=40 /DNA_END=615 /DNA_ORIENTATION=+